MARGQLLDSLRRLVSRIVVQEAEPVAAAGIAPGRPAVAVLAWVVEPGTGPSHSAHQLIGQPQEGVTEPLDSSGQRLHDLSPSPGGRSRVIATSVTALAVAPGPGGGGF